MIPQFAFGLLLTIATMQVVAPLDTIEWDYGEERGPANWGSLDPRFELCKSGKEQSPIWINEDALKERVIRLPRSALKVQYPDQVSLAMNITFDNFGRGLEARKFPSDFEVEYEDSEYQLLQFHFHWYSEHKLFDRNTSLEVHFVHRNEDEKLLVIGMLFEITDKTNYFLDEVLSSYGRPLRKTELRRFVSDSLSRGFFSYNGSLTTPPCTEGVTWIVSPRVQDMSLAQLRRINALMTRNNRPTL